MNVLMDFLRGLNALDWRGRLLLAAIILLSITLFKPQANLPKRVFDWFIVLDITQSMNVRDMTEHNMAMSRLAYSKSAIRASLKSLPCGSRVAIGLFTERDTTTVTFPMEVCEHLELWMKWLLALIGEWLGLLTHLLLMVYLVLLGKHLS